MTPKVYPRGPEEHAETASRILRRHSSESGWPIGLPVPIESIVEGTYGLEILWQPIPEADGAYILGAIEPVQQRILLNERHQAMFEMWIGPERFTLAHELAHWVYDASPREQMAFTFGDAGSNQVVFCHRRHSTFRPADVARIREVNANKLAADLLMPDWLVREAAKNGAIGDLRDTAQEWGVSLTALQIRLGELGLSAKRITSSQRLI